MRTPMVDARLENTDLVKDHLYSCGICQSIGARWYLVVLAAAAVLSLLAYWVLQREPGMLMQALSGLGITDIPLIIRAIITRRLTGSGTSLILGLLLGAGIVVLLRGTKSTNESDTVTSESKTRPFVILLITVGSFLILFPEFFYLRVFKGSTLLNR